MVDSTRNDHDLFNLKGKKAVVTGAGRGIGRGIALRLASAGSDVALLARSPDQLKAVAPTFVETELTREFLSDPDFRSYALSKNLLNRFGTPDDVAGAVLYLASPASNLVTGQVLMVDAGWTAH